MRNKLSVVLSATALFFCVIMSIGVFAKDQLHSNATFDVNRAPKFFIPYEDLSKMTPTSDKSGANLQLLGRIPTVSPGFQAALTTYDYQHNGTMGRQVARRGNFVHMIWMGQNDYVIPGHRRAYYQAFNLTSNSYTQGAGGVSGTEPDYSGYATIDCLNGPSDNAFFACHVSVNGATLYNSVGFLDFLPGNAFFTNYIAATMSPYKETIWPQICVHYGATTNMAYMVSHVGTTDNGEDIVMYRKDLSTGNWDAGQKIAYCTDLSYTVVALDGTDKVAVVFTDDRGGLAQGAGSQTDLDVYYKESIDQGNTWSAQDSTFPTTRSPTLSGAHTPTCRLCIRPTAICMSSGPLVSSRARIFITTGDAV